MDGFDYLTMLIRDADRDFKRMCRKAWDNNYIRIPLCSLAIIGSTLYWVTSLFYILAHLYTSTQHLLSLALYFIGSFGVFLWCSLSLIRKKK